MTHITLCYCAPYQPPPPRLSRIMKPQIRTFHPKEFYVNTFFNMTLECGMTHIIPCYCARTIPGPAPELELETSDLYFQQQKEYYVNNRLVLA